MEFKTQIATTIEQSKKLLELGIKPETADMTHHYQGSVDYYELKDIAFTKVMHLRELTNKNPILGRSGDDLYSKDIPAWSMHRLLSLLPTYVTEEYGEEMIMVLNAKDIFYESTHYCREFNRGANLYDNVINCITWLIREREFNKEYLI